MDSDPASGIEGEKNGQNYQNHGNDHQQGCGCCGETEPAHIQRPEEQSRTGDECNGQYHLRCSNRC